MEVARPDNFGSPCQTRVHRLAYNMSFGEFSILCSSGTANISFSFTAGPDLRLQIHDESQPNSDGEHPAHAIVIFGSEAWKRAINVSNSGSGALLLQPYGLPNVQVHAASGTLASPRLVAKDSRPFFAMPLGTSEMTANLRSN